MVSTFNIPPNMWHISGKSCLKWSTVCSRGLRVASVKLLGWWWYSCHCFDRAKCAGMWLGQKLPWLYCWNATIPMVATAQYVELFLVGCRFCRASIQNNGMPWHLKGDSSIKIDARGSWVIRQTSIFLRSYRLSWKPEVLCIGGKFWPLGVL